MLGARYERVSDHFHAYGLHRWHPFLDECVECAVHAHKRLRVEMRVAVCDFGRGALGSLPIGLETVDDVGVEVRVLTSDALLPFLSFKRFRELV